jgi:ABC-type transport system substrate-binding protein
MSRGLASYVAKRLGFAGLMLAGVSVILFIEAAQRVADQAERKKHYAEFSKILMEDALCVFLYFPQRVYVTRSTYDGFVPIPAFGGIYQSMKAVRFTSR